jgi:hypothetical protein
MEHLWSVFEGRTEKQLSFLHGKALVLWRKIKREKRKFPHRQGIHNELMELWENI